MASFEQFQQVELEYDVKAIKANGIELWPILRVYFASEFIVEKNKEVRLSTSKILPLIRSFFYGLSQFFKKTDYLYFSAADQRKKCGKKYIDRADVLAEMVNNTLIMEVPMVTSHWPKSKLVNQRVCSKTPFFVLGKLLAIFTPTPKIEGEEIIKKVLTKLELHKGYKSIVKRFFAERLLTKFLIKSKNLKGLFLITSYTNIGVVYAFKEMKKPVVEFQHGVIIKSHLAYNINQLFDSKFYPDYLLTFGDKEKEIFDSKNHFIEGKNVFPVGSFIIDYMLDHGFKDDQFSDIKNKYKSVMAFAAQDWFEDQYLPFLKAIAEENTDLCIVLIPRHRKTNHFSKFNLPSNIHFMPWLSTYEIIYLSDFHSTIYSTTVHEATAMGKPSILININDLPMTYFSNDYPEGNGTVFMVDGVPDFNKALKHLQEQDFSISSSQQSIIKPGFEKNLSDFLKAKLPESIA